MPTKNVPYPGMVENLRSRKTRKADKRPSEKK